MRFHKLEEYSLRHWKFEDSDHHFVECIKFREAQKFYAGDVHAIPNSDVSLSDFPRLPFQNCAVEFFDVSYDEGVPINIICSGHEVTTSHIVFEAFARHGGQDHWVFLGEAAFEGDKIRFGHASREDPFTIDGSIKEAPLCAVPQLGEHAHDKPEYKALQMAVFWFAAFFRVINCVNVKTELVEAPKFLNRKRLQKGKLPIYSYKVLVLRASAAQRTNLGGTHESPRIHLRRGHIKHRKTGDFWWQPHVVGDRARGVVMKDYRADELVH